jgi:Na+/proline symporter
MLATVMSAVDSYSFVSAVTLGRDLWWRLVGGDENTVVPRATRVGLFVTATLAIAAALLWHDVIDLWHDFGSVATPAMLAPTLTALYPRWRMRPWSAFVSLVLPAVVSASWIAWAKLHGGALPFGVEAIYPALLVSAVVFAADRLVPRQGRDLPRGK